MTDQDFSQEEYDALPAYVPESGDKHYVDIRFTFKKDPFNFGDGTELSLESIGRTQAVGLSEDDLIQIAEHFAQNDRMQLILSNDIGRIIELGGTYTSP